MKHVRHKRKSRQLLLVTSDAVDAGLKQYRIHPWFLYLLILLLAAAIGVLIGFCSYEREAVAEQQAEVARQQELVAQLEQEKAGMTAEIATLSEEVQILSDTVNQKVQAESQLSEQLERQALPTEFPLTGSASMEETTEGAPMCIFTAAEGSMVVATAGGTVIAVNDEGEYGHNIWIDHGNGYITIYRNQGDVKVKQGETVTQRTTLFLIGADNTKLGYQMMKDGAYINPMDMLVISG